MLKQYIQLKQCTRDSNEGFTLLELLVALIVAAIVIGVSLKFIVDQRNLYAQDVARSQVSQNLRAAMDLVGTDIKLAGQNLSSVTRLPVVQVINGASGASDELVLQRKEMDLIELPVCQPITAGTSTSTIDVSFDPGDPNSCPFSKNDVADPLPISLTKWQEERCKRDGTNGCSETRTVVSGALTNNDLCVGQGGTNKECLWAYIFDPVNRVGEFFHYAYEDSYVDGTQTKYRIYRAPSSDATKNQWQNTYAYDAANPANNPILYLLEERRYRLIDNPSSLGDKILELTLMNQDTKEPITPIRLVNQLSNFQVSAIVVTDPTTTPISTATQEIFPVTTPTAYTWRNLQSIQVDLTARNPSQGTITVPNNSLSAKFFPRNIASQKN